MLPTLFSRIRTNEVSTKVVILEFVHLFQIMMNAHRQPITAMRMQHALIQMAVLIVHVHLVIQEMA